MSWTERVLLAFPVDLFGTLDETLARINALAYVVDPDSGGADTFSAERIQNGYFIAESQFVEGFIAFLGADTATWQAVLTDCAQAKGAEPLTPGVVAVLRDGLRFGDAAQAAIQVPDASE